MLPELTSTSLTSVLVVPVLIVLAVQVWRWLVWYRSYFSFFNSLPGETDFSCIWGNMHKDRHMSSAQRIEYLMQMTERFPKFYRLWLGPFVAAIVLNHPDTAKELLKTSDPKLMLYQFGIHWLGEGLLIASGAKWARMRRLLTPAFHFDILKPYVAVSNRATDILMNKMKTFADEDRSMEVFNMISLCTLDTILRCAMSYTDEIQAQGNSHPYVQAVTELTELWAEREKNPVYMLDFAYRLTKNGRRFMKLCDFVHGISEGIIKERQQTLERDGPPKKRYLDFLDILLTAKDESGKGLSFLEIRNEVDTFMFEGHDTTASAVAWVLYSLCRHPEYKDKVQLEVDKVLQGRLADDLLWSDLPKLDYLTMVIKEGMRLHCPVPFIGRTLSRPVTLEGVEIPAGTMCVVNLLTLHHNRLVWADPETFRPERFLPDNTKDMDSYAFIPFSAGPRNCIGQHFAMNEAKVILGQLLRRYTFRLDPKYPAEKKIAAVMRTVSGMKMFATPRTPSL